MWTGYNLWNGGFLADINDIIELKFMDNLMALRLPPHGFLLTALWFFGCHIQLFGLSGGVQCLVKRVIMQLD
jgi:hypothetical protein